MPYLWYINKKPLKKRGLIFNLVTFQKERGLTKFYGANIIHIFVFPKKMIDEISNI